MDIVAALGVVVGGCAFYTSMRVASRVNAGRRLPYWRNPDVPSATAIGLRALGVFLVALSAGFLPPTIGYWSAVVSAAALAPGIMAIPAHNRRVAALE
ncbi:hypothetical protein [Microbacterium yannicii]|uniref:hypothetical protein n=1 Tax=Microbacterium yannicii TaxID=671622 RepID=UPI0003703AAA|nr:hypothetical protein [Microbacterium yannicii]